MAVNTKLEKKKFGVHMRGLTKVLPWLYPAFAAIFLGLNIAGITTGLGSGILGNLPQGAILNGNIWQSIANGAYLLGQGSLVAVGVAGVASIYPAIRNITSYARYKKAEQFNFVKNRIEHGVIFDKELQATESIINSMIPSSTIGSSRIEQALALRYDSDMAQGLRKMHLKRKAVWQEDVIRRSIVKLTDRLAELTRMENRGWKSYSSKTGILTLTASEITTRKQEMRMIQDYLATILNKVDAKDPFVTTLLAQVKKYRVDKLNDGTKVAGIHLVQESTDPAAIAVANEINNKLVKGDVKIAVTKLYNYADNDLASVTFGPTDAVTKAIANINLKRANDAADQAERAANAASTYAGSAKTDVDNIVALENKANIILSTLRNTLINARNKKQKINKAAQDAVKALTDIGYTKQSAEAACKAILKNQTDADTALADIQNKQTDAGKALIDIQNMSKNAQKILKKLGNQKSTATRILNKLNNVIIAANGNMTTIRKIVKDSYDELAKITKNKDDSVDLIKDITDQYDIAQDIVQQILDEKQNAEKFATEAGAHAGRAKTHADNAKSHADRAKTSADNADTEYAKAKDYAVKSNTLYANIVAIKNALTPVLTDATATKDDIERAKTKAMSQLAEIEIYGKKAEGIVNTIVKNAKKSRQSRNKAQSNADKSNNAQKSAKNSADEAMRIVADIHGLHATATSETDSIATLNNDATALLTKIDAQLQKAQKSANQTKSYEQSAQQIRIRMTQLENTSKQIIGNIQKLYNNLKTDTKVSTQEISQAKQDLQEAIDELKTFIAETENNTSISVATLQDQLDQANKLLNNISDAEKEAKDKVKAIKDTVKKYVNAFNTFATDYNATLAGFNSLEQRLDSIETRLNNGENMAQELSKLSEAVATLSKELENLKNSRVTQDDLKKLNGKVIGQINEINLTIDNLSISITEISNRINGLKVIKPASPEKVELNQTLKEIKNWARVICWAVATNVEEIKMSSLGGATRYIKRQISGPSKKTNGAISYTEDEMIGETLNDFLGTSYEDVSKITDLKEAKLLLSKIETEVKNYNDSHNFNLKK